MCIILLSAVCVSLCRYRTYVSEDAGPNTFVATVLAQDPDGDGVTYSIIAGNEEGNFVIDSQKGDSFPAFLSNYILNFIQYIPATEIIHATNNINVVIQ